MGDVGPERLAFERRDIVRTGFIGVFAFIAETAVGVRALGDMAVESPSPTIEFLFIAEDGERGDAGSELRKDCVRV